MAAETKDQILDAAEQLFSEDGIDGVSLRAITNAASVNLAAVNYHFGSKEALVRSVFVRRISGVNRERLDLLDEFEAKAGGGPLAIEDVLYALFAPAIRLSQDPARGRRFMRLCGRFYSESAEYLEPVFAECFAELIGRVTTAAKRALPDLPDRELSWRLHFAVGAMAHTMMDSDRLRKWSRGLCDPADVDAAIEAMVQFSAAGLKAPVSGAATQPPTAILEEVAG